MRNRFLRYLPVFFTFVALIVAARLDSAVAQSQAPRAANQKTAPRSATKQAGAAKKTSPGKAAASPRTADRRDTAAASKRRGAAKQSTSRVADSSRVDPSRIFAGGAPQSVADLKAMQGVMQRLAERVAESTVSVRVGSAQGSGVIVNREGYVFTAAHVIGGPGRDATLTLNDGRSVRGRTLGANYDLDAGLIQITDEGDWKVAEVGDSKQLKVGQWCLATGHPGGFQRGRTAVVRFGRILKVADDGITTDCTLVGGDSGGPVFDMEGRVIGIHSRIGNSLSANVHIPVAVYRTDWDRLAKGEAWGMQPGIGPFIGVVGAAGSSDAKIASVTPGGPAEEAGIRPGDVITRFDGAAIDDFESLIRAVAETEPGDRVALEIRRGDETVRLRVTIGSREDY